jgi:hypothetical protein
MVFEHVSPTECGERRAQGHVAITNYLLHQVQLEVTQRLGFTFVITRLLHVAVIVRIVS